MTTLFSAVRSPKSIVAQTKAIQWLNNPRQARIGRILNKFKDNVPASGGWPETWSAIFEEDSTAISSEWPIKQFHEFQALEFDSSAFLLKGFLTQEVQLLLIQTYREAMRANKLRMTPPDKAGKNLVGTASLGWRRQARGYGEPKAELPDFIYDLAQLVSNVAQLPALGAKQKCSAFLQRLDCYTNQGVEVPLHTEDTGEDADLFETGQPLIIFSLGCQASFYWRAKTKHLIESGDCIIFGKKSRLMQYGISEVIPDTEPQLPTLTTPFKGTTIVTVRQVKS